MKIRLISDVVLAPVVKELKKALPAATVHDSFEEDLVTYLLAFDPATLSGDEWIFIHTDQQFHLKPANWQQQYFRTVQQFVTRVPNRVLVSNAWSLSFASPALAGAAGKSVSTWLNYQPEIEAMLTPANVFIFDIDQLMRSKGLETVYQYNLGHLYQMPYTKSFSSAFATRLAEQITWLGSEEKKAILVDCDNTLWKGILGENGLDGIQCDNNAEGILYYHFQLFLKAKKEEGFLLCVCSKNNEADVKEAFDTRNMPLAWNDFVVKKVDWNDKWQNIQLIAKELNIGVDSLIFIDDNPFEINSVKELLPGITALTFTPDYPAFLQMTENFLFRRKRILAADLEKSKQYEIEQARKQVEQEFTSIEDFIKSLEIRMDIRRNDIADIERLAQMTGKTNQFNFNKKEYSPDELSGYISEGNRVYSLKVADRFGDYGTVGIILLNMNGDKAIMENYLMSCRALGKRIEQDFFRHVLDELQQEYITLESIKFQETAKNKPAQDFYKNIGNEYNHRSAAGNLPVGT